MFDIIRHTLSAAVATAGTFTVSYPANRSAGDYTYGHKHLMSALQTVFVAPTSFTLTFGASSITVTYNGSTTLPAGTDVLLQVDRLGTNEGAPEAVVLPFNVSRAPVALLSLGAPDTADADGILNDASATDSATSYDSSDWVTTFDGTLDVPRNLTATGTAGSNHVITVTGTDSDSNTLKESLTLNGTNVISGKKAFKTVTNVAVAAGAAGDTFDLGWGDVLGLPVYIPDAAHVLAEFKNGVVLPRKPGVVYIMDRMLEAAVDAGTAHNIVCPVAGRITKLTTIAQAAITTGGDITVEVNTTLVDGLTVTVGAAAEGEVDSGTPTADHASAVVAVGDRIEIIPASAFNASADIFFILEIATSAAGMLDGTLVAGVTSKATATTGDVRGTYDPAVACDGATSFDLLVALPDPGNAGVPQYTG